MSQKKAEISLSEIAEENALLLTQIAELKARLSDSVSCQHHKKEVTMWESKYEALHARLEEAVSDRRSAKKILDLTTSWEQEKAALKTEISSLTSKSELLVQEHSNKIAILVAEHKSALTSCEEKFKATE